MALIACLNLTMAYDKLVAVKDVSFSVDEGDYLCIVGENGAGKSTLVKGILGLLRPTAGTIGYHGLSPKEIGYLPQQTVVQKDFPASVHEVILSGCLNRTKALPFYTPALRARAQTQMERLSLTPLAKRCYRELSGGQQQRVLLARALCATDKLLLLDEPVAGLDPLVTAELYALIQKLNREEGITVIMISHDIHSAIKYGNKILQLQNAGVFFGPTQEYLQTEIGRRMMGGAATC